MHTWYYASQQVVWINKYCVLCLTRDHEHYLCAIFAVHPYPPVQSHISSTAEKPCLKIIEKHWMDSSPPIMRHCTFSSTFPLTTCHDAQIITGFHFYRPVCTYLAKLQDRARARWPLTTEARVCVGFMVDKVELGQVLFWALRSSPVSVIPSMLRAYSFTYHRRLYNLSTGQRR
jgi:hypothetical protein